MGRVRVSSFDRSDFGVNRRKPHGRSGVGIVMLTVTALLAGWMQPASAQEWSAPRTVYVESAGHTVDGLFLDVWRAHPTLLGEPITEEITAKAPVGLERDEEHIVQYYENVALVYLPEAEPGERVETLPLGKHALEADAERFPARRLPITGSCGALTEDACLQFDETGHTLRDGFLTFWEENGGEQFLGLPISEEFDATDGYRTQYFEQTVLRWKKDKDVTPRALGTEAARRLKLDTKRIDQPLSIPIYEESLFVPPVVEQVIEPAIVGIGGQIGGGPGMQQGGYKEIVVSVSAQTLWAYENGSLVTSSLVSTGTGNVPETVTPIGHYQVLVKFETETMEGTISDEYYLVEDVPSVMYFDNLGNAIHGTYWHSNFGTPMSHGCVNLPLDVAAFLYSWAEIGTPVSIIP